jgi:hypothetical protein
MLIDLLHEGRRKEVKERSSRARRKPKRSKRGILRWMPRSKMNSSPTTTRLTRIAITRILGACNQEIESVNLGHGITFGIICRIITIGIISIITIGSNIIRGGKLNKRVFYYSVELFCFILLDYSVWKMYQTNNFHFFQNGIFFKLL